MQNRCVTNHYTFHGLGVTVSSNHPGVTAALQARLQPLLTRERGPVDLRFEFCGIPENAPHRIEKPRGAARPIYDPPAGEVVYSDEADLVYINYENRVRVLCDPGRGAVRVSFLPPDTATLWLLSHPMFTLPWIEILKRRGRYSLHAAGLSIKGQGLLLPGASGAGKSTLALALVRVGCGFLGDDMVFLTPHQDGLRVLAFPDEVDVSDDTVGLFPELHGLLQCPKVPGWPKRQVRAEAVYDVEMAWECRPVALIFPRMTARDKSYLHPMDRDAALLELVPNVLLTEVRSSQAHLDVLAELVRASACYRLEIGRDLDALPGLLRDVVA